MPSGVVLLYIPSSGTLRTGTSSCARAARYHTNAIAVSDFTIATRKWAKLYKHRVRRCHALRKMFYFYLAEGKLAEACVCFTIKGLTAGVSREPFLALTDFTWLYR